MDLFAGRTRVAFLWSRLLYTPFFSLFLMLPFILHRDLHASLLQVTLIFTIKPAASILSMYWSAYVRGRCDRLVKNLLWARVLGHLPFFFFPFVDNPWFYVVACGIHMFLYRGVIPAWMELLKLNIPDVSRERLFAYAASLGYIGDVFLSFLFGWLLDSYHQAWRWLFPLAAVISLLSLLSQRRILVRHRGSDTQVASSYSLIKPWQDAFQLLKERPDFYRFLIGFMIGGSGVMIMQPALPTFFMDSLSLSYKELALALPFCKGAGFVLTSPHWARLMTRVDLYRFNSYVTTVACLFPALLLFAPTHIGAIYAAYLAYGVMQAGSELGWNLSGPAFSGEDDSSLYSSVNVLSVGIRGLVVPSVGSLICQQCGAPCVIAVGGFLCLAATMRLRSYSQSRAQVTNTLSTR